MMMTTTHRKDVNDLFIRLTSNDTDYICEFNVGELVLYYIMLPLSSHEIGD